MEAKCEYYVKSCQDFVPRQSTVIRDGIPQVVEQRNLVVGDVIIFNRGNEIAADIKLTELSGVKIHREQLNEVQQYYYTQLYGQQFEERYFKTGDLLFYSSFISFGEFIFLKHCLKRNNFCTFQDTEKEL